MSHIEKMAKLNKPLKIRITTPDEDKRIKNLYAQRGIQLPIDVVTRVITAPKPGCGYVKDIENNYYIIYSKQIHHIKYIKIYFRRN